MPYIFFIFSRYPHWILLKHQFVFNSAFQYIKYSDDCNAVSKIEDFISRTFSVPLFGYAKNVKIVKQCQHSMFSSGDDRLADSVCVNAGLYWLHYTD